MKFSNTLAALLLISNATALAHPQPIADDLVELHEFDPRSDEQIFAEASELYKRKGGGGGGGKGGGSSSSGSSSGSGKGGSSSSSSGSSSGSSSNRGSSSSNAGGATKSGSGAPKGYGGGRYYGGGAATPYSPGSRSPSGILPLAVGVGVGGAAAAIAVSHYPGFWPYGFYSYPYVNQYQFHNRTGRKNGTGTSTSSSATTSPTSTLAARSHPLLMNRQDDGTGVNETKPVTCLCAPYAVCGCDEPANSTFLDSLIGDGTYSSLNQSVVTVADINGTSTIVLNGTLPNGTTASGGTDDATSGASPSPTSTSKSSIAGIFGASGYFVMVALVGCTVFMV